MTPLIASRRSLLPHRRQCDGLGLIDCLVSLVVISLSSFGFLAASMSSTALDVETRTIAAANRITRGVLEEMQSIPMDELIRRFNADPADDPDGPGTARGDTFELQTTETKRDPLVVVEDLYDPNCTYDPNASCNTTTSDRTKVSIGSIPPKMDCRVDLPTTISGGIEKLREDTVAPELGLPADLNGDGQIDSVDHFADFKILPVRIRIQWPGSDGSLRSVDLTAVLGGRGKS